MGSCATCKKREECTRDTGIIFGFCNTEYEAENQGGTLDAAAYLAEKHLQTDKEEPK
ncbi:MAG: hypothetical protein WC374_13025 [Phycisphaerae bacterium]|jgi:hypothetical protein